MCVSFSGTSNSAPTKANILPHSFINSFTINSNDQLQPLVLPNTQYVTNSYQVSFSRISPSVPLLSPPLLQILHTFLLDSSKNFLGGFSASPTPIHSSELPSGLTPLEYWFIHVILG